MNSTGDVSATLAAKDRYHISARSSVEGVGQIEANNTKIRFDRSWGVSPGDLPGPAELLCSAFAACVIKNVERFSQVLPFDYESVEIEVEAHRQNRPPRFDRLNYVVRIVTDEPEARVDLLARNLAKHGTVFNTLAASCDVTGQVLAVAPHADIDHSTPPTIEEHRSADGSGQRP